MGRRGPVRRILRLSRQPPTLALYRRHARGETADRGHVADAASIWRFVMASTPPGICEFGWKARDFALTGIDGRTWSLADARGPKGTLIAIMPNDTHAYPQDSFDNMQRFAAQHGFPFPYVIDETQDVARAYAAQCTPDFFGFNAADELQYRGRLDASRTTLVPGARRELFEAMRQVAETGRGPVEQVPSMGCSIKWRA